MHITRIIAQKKLTSSTMENQNKTVTRILSLFFSAKFLSFLGIVLSIISASLFSIGDLMIKLAPSIPGLEVVFIRLIFQLVFSLPPMIFMRDKFIHHWKKTGFLVLRGFSGVTGIALTVYCVKNMSISDARVIFCTTTVFTALLGRIFLKESITKYDVIATMLCLGGVVLITKPTFLFGSLSEDSSTKQEWFPVVMAVLCSIVFAFSTILVRKISQDVGTRVVVFYFAAIGSVVSLCASLISGGFKYPDCGTHDIYYIIAYGFLGYFASLLDTKACELEKAAVVSLVRIVEIPCSFILQIMFLDVVPTRLSIGGALLVLLSNVVIFVKKHLNQKKKNNRGYTPIE